MSRRGVAFLGALVLALTAATVIAQSPSSPGVVGLGAYCSHSTNCSAAHSVCENRICICESGYEINGTTCTIKLNSNCNSTRLCNRTGAHCIDNVCICRFDHVLSANYQNCVPVATSLNQSCEVQAQCREFINSSCSASICQCIPGHHYDIRSRSCEKTSLSPFRGAEPMPHAPQHMAEPDRRTGLHSVQSPGVMQQPNHLPARNHMTTNRKGLGSNCSIDANCTINTTYSVCRNGRCECASGYEANGTICLSTLNMTCNTTYPCNRDGTVCDAYTKLCKCNENSYVQSSNGRNCLKLATQVNGPCSDNQQCKILGNTTCYTGSCVCRNGYFVNYNGNKCESFPCVQGSCDYMGFATCSANMCYCRSDAVGYGSLCYKQIGKIGDKCDTSRLERCHLNLDGVHQNVECSKGKCACIKPYKANKAKTSCVSGASIAAIASPIFILVTLVGSIRM